MMKILKKKNLMMRNKLSANTLRKWLLRNLRLKRGTINRKNKKKRVRVRVKMSLNQNKKRLLMMRMMIKKVKLNLKKRSLSLKRSLKRVAKN